MATARALMSALELSAEKITVAFQSRLGNRPWIEPFSDQVVDQLARDGVRRLLVSCPSFVADCLETLEEVQIRLREQFIAAGGEDLRLVPALNAEDIWVHDFSQMVTRHNLHWWES
jgi:ferrochelatase